MIMHKVYKIDIFRAGYVLAIICSILFVALAAFFVLYSIFHFHYPFIIICVMTGFLIIALFLFYLFSFYFNKLEVHVDNEILIYKMPDQTITFNIKDIYKIEKDFSYAGVGYYIFYYDNNRKKKHIKLTQHLEDAENLIEYLEKESDIKMRWEGTLDVEKEKRPVMKGLKIVYNIFIVCFIIGFLVVYPFLASCNRSKEQAQHLQEHSLWP